MSERTKIACTMLLLFGWCLSGVVGTTNTLFAQQQSPSSIDDELGMMMEFDWDPIVGTWRVTTAKRDGKLVENMLDVEYYIEPRLMRWVATKRIYELTGMPLTQGRILNPTTDNEVSASAIFPSVAPSTIQFDVEDTQMKMTITGADQSSQTVIELNKISDALPRPKRGEMISLAQQSYTNEQWDRAAAFAQLQMIHYPGDGNAELLLVRARLKRALSLSGLQAKPDDLRRTSYEATWAISKHPDQMDVRSLYASVLMKYLQLEDAMVQWKVLDEKDALDAEARIEMARCHIGLRQNEAAKNILADIVDFDTNRNEFRASASYNYPAAISTLAAILANEGKSEKAEEMMRRLIEREPTADSYLVRARYFVFMKQPEKARDDIQTALELEPEQLNAMLAGIEANLGSDDPSVDALIARALELHGAPIRILTYAATRAARRNEHQSALEYAQRGLEKQPTDLTLNLMVPELHARLGNSSAATSALKQMIESGVPMPMVRLAQARVYLAQSRLAEATQIVRALAKTQMPPQLRAQLQALASQIQRATEPTADSTEAAAPSPAGSP